MASKIDYPRVLNVAKEEGILTLELAIDASLNVFDGHFDDAPIVPGIVQVAWALGFSNEYLGVLNSLDITGLESVKFQNVVVPGLVINLELRLQQNKLYFSYSSDSGKYSSGKVTII